MTHLWPFICFFHFFTLAKLDPLCFSSNLLFTSQCARGNIIVSTSDYLERSSRYISARGILQPFKIFLLTSTEAQILNPDSPRFLHSQDYGHPTDRPGRMRRGVWRRTLPTLAPSSARSTTNGDKRDNPSGVLLYFIQNFPSLLGENKKQILPSLFMISLVFDPDVIVEPS